MLSSGLTFLLTRSTEGKNDKKIIYKIQLEKKFLPLYLIVNKIDIDNPNKENVLRLIENLNKKNFKYFLYIPNTYVKLNDKMYTKIENSNVSKKELRILADYIKWKYFYLKKKMNYPDQSLFIWGNFFGKYYLLKIMLYLMLGAFL